METLIRDLIPHAPQMGLYVAPDVPSDKRRNAIQDYAPDVNPEDVLALYDATLMGNAKDGALFTPDCVVFQNTDLQSPQTVRYRDLVGITLKKRLLGGKKVMLDVNRGRATFQLALDFSGASDAAEYVQRFLEKAMHESAQQENGIGPASHPAEGTDVEAVQSALDDLHQSGQLAETDYQRLLRALGA
jgi:hypothetical protein